MRYDEQEIFVPIFGYEDSYTISNYGSVYSYITKQLITGWIDRGYKRVELVDAKGIRHSFSVHNLVALHFVPNPGRYEFVYPKDHNLLNCYYKNLMWSERLGNIK